jgi:hypothetical protein
MILGSMVKLFIQGSAQCWISGDHFTTKIVTEYLWFWFAWLFSFLTALAYLFVARNNKRLSVGFLWIGFPVREGRLLRLGLVSIDKNDPGTHKRLRCSFSLFEATFHPRTVRVMLPVPAQYVEVESDPMQASTSTDAQRVRNTAFKLLLYVSPEICTCHVHGMLFQVSYL